MIRLRVEANHVEAKDRMTQGLVMSTNVRTCGFVLYSVVYNTTPLVEK